MAAGPRTRQLAAGALTLALVAACGSDSPVRDPGTRAVVIGIDGADWKVIEALAAEGGMANLMGLRERGVWGPIETLHDMPLSPVIWTTVATGKSPAEHGISWFMVDQPDGTRVPVRSHNRRVKAIWNILAEHRRRPIVVGWWATYPAEEVGDGAIVSDALGFHGFGSTARGGDDAGKTYPASILPQVDARIPAVQQIGHDYAARYIHVSPEQYRRLMFTPVRFKELDPLNPIHLFQQYAVTAEGYTAIAEDLIESRPYDLFMVYFEQVDSLSHLFMKYAPPKLEWVDAERRERFRDVVSEWYRHQDELLGRLLAKIDLDQTAVFVLSDHGFKSGERRIRSEETVDVRKAHLDHETHGVFIAAGPHLRHGAEIAGASVFDVAPTVLHYLGFPVARDMDGRVLERVFEPGFLSEHPIRYLETYEDPTAPEKAPAAAEYAEEDAERNLEALRALGYVDGEEAAETAGDGEETSPELLTNLGRIHLANGDPDAAHEQLAKALEVDPDYADALLALGEVYRLKGLVADAEHVIKRALQVDPNSVGALSQLGEIERDKGALGEAIRLFEEALRIDDSQPFLFLGYGDVLQRAGRYDDAVRAFQSVLELDPDSFKACYNLGVTYANQGRVEEAVARYEKALELDPAHPEAAKALNNLGVVHLARGEVERAAGRFAQARAASPVNIESRYNLARIHLAGGRTEEAVELLEEAAALRPNHELVSVRLGMAYLLLGRHQDAYKSLLLVRRLYPRNWEAALGLALLHADAGQGEQAKELLDDALRLGGEAARRQAAEYPLLKELL
ncbi:MAG: tetratricopeptide repeat protein [bacterium]|nr:tetratricopeptide repeat protein [bacterium]